jgi:hypothetical protein
MMAEIVQDSDLFYLIENVYEEAKGMMLSLETLIEQQKIVDKTEINKICALEKAILALSNFSCDLMIHKYDDDACQDDELENEELKCLYPHIFDSKSSSSKKIQLSQIVDLIEKEYKTMAELMSSIELPPL